ncbi:SpoIIE family protein phosphatase [Candidatus Gracilibacteria bacterium]|nr:SpoIIE family protein phosphatase [Candidatus Gracilibacteria bacterium]
MNEIGTILVVDDNENNRDLLARRLQKRGHSIVVAEDGVQCLELLARQRFDMVLLDIMMPRMDGYEVLEHLRDDNVLRYIPVIVISAVGELDSVVRCIELGAEDYLLKPFNPVLLHAKIDACLEKKRLRDQERAYLASVKQELELGRRTQADFLPASLPRVTGWEIAAAFHPAREVAGDFYDAFVLPGGLLGFVIADVCDKGVGAALFMALTRSLVRAFAEQQYGGDPTDALRAVALTNSYIARHHRESRMFATLFFGLLDPDTGELTYVNGGHPAPVLIRQSGDQDFLDPTGPAVGIADVSRFSVGSAWLRHGDTVLAYTDGATEVRDASGEMFGEERLLSLLQAPIFDITRLMQHIDASARAHLGHDILPDDITMLAIKRV